jgi:hypothetical protein
MSRIFDFLYRRILYRYTIAYKKLFPSGRFIDDETPYTDEVKLILKAIKEPDFDLEEMDMGIVLSQLIQSDIDYNDAWKICAIVNRRYNDAMHYMTRRNIVEQQLDEWKRKPAVGTGGIEGFDLETGILKGF